MRTISLVIMLAALLVFIALPAAAHNWHQEFTHWSGSGNSSVSNFGSSTGGATGSFSVIYSDPAPDSNELYRDSANNQLVISCGSTSKRYRFGSDLVSSVRPETGAAIGWCMEKIGANVTRAPIQFCLTKANGHKWTTYIVVTGSQIIPRNNSGSQLSGVDALSLSLSGMNSYSLSGKESGGWTYWKLWVNGTLQQFTGSNGGSGNTDPWGQSYSFRSGQDGTASLSRIGLGELHKSTDWGWRFAYVRWTDEGSSYFGDPYIHSNPASQTKGVGETATFTVETWSDGTREYQWQVRPAGGSWSNISGATSSSYTTPVLTGNEDGNQYRCLVRRSGWPWVYSGAATLTLVGCVPPSITVHPVSQTVCAGEPVTFSVTASGSSPNYQWRKNGSNISGAVGSSYTIPSVTPGNAGNYDCVVTNDCGSVTSNAAVLTVNTIPSITTQPASVTVPEGGTATLTVVAEGTAPISYQWRKNGVNIIDAVASILTITDAKVEDSGSYDCVISNLCGSVTSEAAILAVAPPLYPLGLTNRSIGGGDWHYDPNTGAGQKGVTDGVGLNTTGILVRTWGKVTHAASDIFYLDDGSGLEDGSGNPGVKVQMPAGVNPPDQDSFVSVTGVSSCYKIGDNVYPLIILRNQDDITLTQ